ncbi:MAG TPA: hypothetical protein VMW93_08720 [bacterium]|nr:hypothetical protein [bacterium]
MRNFLAVAVAVGLVVMVGGCEKIKTLSGKDTESAPDSVTAPASAEPAKKAFRAPTKEEYYRMLREGYKPPRRSVRAGGPGYSGAGAAPGERREISEKEGEALKIKFGEGRKYAASGRGEEPEVPSYIDEDEDGTNPPREFEGHDR